MGRKKHKPRASASVRREPAIVESLAIEVPPERAWRALTSPRDLAQLVLGRVEMGATPGAGFRWQWGVWETVAPKLRGRGHYTWQGQVLDCVPGSTLVLGSEPVVTFTVKGEGASALVTVVQGSAPAGAKLEDYEYGWADFLLRLKTLLETEHTQNEVLLRALMRATPQQVYRAWLSPRVLAKLIPGKAKLRARVGGRFTWQHKHGQHVHQGTFLELARNRTLAFSWESSEGPKLRLGQLASEVRIGMHRAPYGTLVSVHHTGLLRMNPGQLFAQRTFWNRLLERLRCYFYFKGKIRAR
ncbi:MAG: SRPBCC family protein [Terriglobia bacterium]